MTIKELIARLAEHNPEREVMVLDSHNGGGNPRAINLGPHLHRINADDCEATGDCEDREGEMVVTMGYGCY
jgi:hypothetical protein